MKKSFILLLSILLSLTLFSCASKPKVQKERSDTYIANLEPFYIGELHLYTRLTIASPKISDFSLSFIPRTNSIKVTTKIGLDYFQIFFPYAERQNLKESAQKYLDDYANNQLKNEKPTKKNTLYKATLPVSWGVLGFSHDIDQKCNANIEYLELDKPYYRLKFDAATAPEDGSTSPAFSIYISPSQWQSIFEMCDQASLEAQCDEIIAQAEAF